jgi:hypothetical protein
VPNRSFITARSYGFVFENFKAYDVCLNFTWKRIPAEVKATDSTPNFSKVPNFGKVGKSGKISLF